MLPRSCRSFPQTRPCCPIIAAHVSALSLLHYPCCSSLWTLPCPCCLILQNLPKMEVDCLGGLGMLCRSLNDPARAMMYLVSIPACL